MATDLITSEAGFNGFAISPSVDVNPIIFRRLYIVHSYCTDSGAAVTSDVTQWARLAISKRQIDRSES